jgi:hypothetical protein
MVGGDEHGQHLGSRDAGLPDRVGEGPQTQVEEAGRVGLLGAAQGDLDVGGLPGRQRNPAARPSGALLTASQQGQQPDDPDGQQAGADQPGDDPKELAVLLSIGRRGCGGRL